MDQPGRIATCPALAERQERHGLRCRCVQLGSKGQILNDHMFRANSSAEYVVRASKVITMVDLAGHERYFKTTAYGLTGHLPDYACLIVGANAGAPHYREAQPYPLPWV